MRLSAFVLVAALGAADVLAAARTGGGVSISVDEESAFPGGVLTVRLSSRKPIRGIVYGILDGRRCPAFWTRDGMRALVPIPVTHAPGRVTLAVEIRRGGGRRRYAVPVTIAPRAYPSRVVFVPEAKRPVAGSAESVRDGRVLLQYLRTVSPRKAWDGGFRPPVDVPAAASFGSPQTYDGLPAVESTMDSIHGEYHRGLDYDVEPGTAVKAPAPGTVLFSGTLTLSGRTIVIDHGHGLLSVFSHLAESAVRQGEWVDTGRALGTSGESGIAAVPHLHWAVYLHGVAIDPRVTEKL